MTFSDQVRRSRKWGAILLLLGLPTFGALYLLHTNGRNDLALYGANFCTAIIGLAVSMLVLGTLSRPVQKKFCHYALEANERSRGNMACNPIMRWFLRLDTEGRDRYA